MAAERLFGTELQLLHYLHYPDGPHSLKVPYFSRRSEHFSLPPEAHLC